MHYIFQDSLMNRKFKRTALFETDVIFDVKKNKSINFSIERDSRTEQ